MRWKHLFPRVPLLIAGAYATVSVLWIALSDQALTTIAGGYDRYQELQTYKGWLFVAASTLLIYFLLRAAWKGILAAFEASSASERRLHLALDSAGGGIWELDLTGKGEGVAHISAELIARLGLPPERTLTMAELGERRHPADAAEADRKLIRALASGGRQPYDDRYRLRCEDGVHRWVHVRGNVVASADGRPQRLIGVALDIDEQVKAEQRIGELLRYDPVTGLARQNKLLTDLDEILAEKPATGWVAVMQLRLLDLNRLIDETETVEDAALVRTIGDRLHALPDLLAARITADVFALATQPAPSPTLAQRILGEAVEGLLEPVHLAGGSIRLRVRAGGALALQGTGAAIALLRESGHALDLADHGTENGIRWFNDELSVEYYMQTNRMRGLDGAVARREIECLFQPLIDLRSGQTSGFEALARWRRPDGTVLLPNQFIRLAEDVGKIGEIGEYILATACEAAARWPEPHPMVAVNVSPMQLEDDAFPDTVARILAKTGLPPAQLELEITENALPRDPDLARQRVLALRDLGVAIAIDDFGTGYSSLALLSEMPFTRLKIDRSFVSGSGNPRRNTIIVDTIIDLAQNLGLAITAEGVETADQAATLAGKGVDVAQGYYFSEPVAAAQAERFASRTWLLPPAAPKTPPELRLVR